MEKNKELLTDFSKQYPDVFTIKETEELLRIQLTDKIKDIDLNSFVNELFDIETKLAEEGTNYISLDLKGLDIHFLEEIIRIALQREDLADPLMTLNIFNLIKIYNTLNPQFFENENIYILDTSGLLDLRLDLQEELEAFVKQLSIYFLSLFKSYNKTTYIPTDTHQKLPRIYKTIFLTSDLLTLSGIFSSSAPFSTSELVYLEDAIECIYSLEEKCAINFSLISNMIKGLENDKCEYNN